MNIQQAAELSGLAPDTIRFYERRGILPRPPRRANGYRDYAEDHVAVLILARGLREIGLPLVELHSILQVAHDGSCGDLRSTLVGTLEDSLRDIDQRMLTLAATREYLATLVSGLRRMRRNQDRVPGTTPCECVRLIGADG